MSRSRTTGMLLSTSCAVVAAIGLGIASVTGAVASPEGEIARLNRVRANLFEELVKSRAEAASARAELEAAIQARDAAEAELARLRQQAANAKPADPLPSTEAKAPGAGRQAVLQLHDRARLVRHDPAGAQLGPDWHQWAGTGRGVRDRAQGQPSAQEVSRGEAATELSASLRSVLGLGNSGGRAVNDSCRSQLMGLNIAVGVSRKECRCQM
jgi:hypothetical protein